MTVEWGVGADTTWALSGTATERLDGFRPLLAAEEEVVAKLLNGSFDRLGDGSRPEGPDPARVIRASVLRFLLLGGEEGCRPHEKGIRISGAWITDVLDLEACRIVRDIGLNDCHFEAPPVLRAAIINRLFLDGSLLPGLQAERLEARGGVYLRGAEVNGEVNLAQSRLGGNLECDGATINAPGGYALLAPSLEVRSVLVRGARLQGGINVSGAELAADLDCAGTVFARTEGVTFDASAIDARGSVLLRSARIEGETRLTASHVGADMDCSGAVLDNPGKTALEMINLGGMPLTSGALAKLAAKPMLGDGALSSAMALAAAGSTLLMLQFLMTVARDGSRNPETPAPYGQILTWLVIVAASLVIPWTLYPAIVGEPARNLFEAEALWTLLWPMALGGIAMLVINHFPKLSGAVPEGDIVVLAEAGGPALNRLILRFRQADAGLRRWPLAGLSLLAITILLGGVLILGA
jgi:hypothetical protein